MAEVLKVTFKIIERSGTKHSVLDCLWEMEHSACRCLNINQPYVQNILEMKNSVLENIYVSNSEGILLLSRVGVISVTELLDLRIELTTFNNDIRIVRIRDRVLAFII